MKKLKIFAIALGALMCVPLALCLNGCGKKSPHTTVSSKDVYAMSALSTVMYLESDQLPSASAMNVVRENRIAINEEDKNGAISAIKMFRGILQNNGFKQTVEKNTEEEPDLSTYNFVMTISLPNLQSSNEIKLYYDEIETMTQRELDDEEEESETSTTLEGVIVDGQQKYTVTGRRTVEVEGKEVEVSIEFVTKIDEQNYIKVEQSIEDNEVEYEYGIYTNGQKVQDIEIEVEQNKGKTELEYELVDLTNGTRKETKYKLKTIDNQTYEVTLYRNNTSDKFTIQYLEGEDEQFKFTYSDGSTI